MTLMSRHDPFRQGMSLRNAMDQLFAQSFVNPLWSGAASTIYTPMDVYEAHEGYIVRVSIPGVRPEDLDATIEQNTLTIKGTIAESDPGKQGQQREQGQEQEHTWLLREIPTGSFERTITFGRPIDTEHVESKLEHGILTLSIPIAQSSRPRKISVGNQEHREQIPVEAGHND